MSGQTTTSAKKPLLQQLWMQVLIAMGLGIGLGHFYPQLGESMQPLGDAFIKAIRVMIAPIIFCTVIHGIAHVADFAKVGRVAIKALVYFEIVTTIALVIGLVSINLFQPGAGMNISVATIDTTNVKPLIAQTQNIGTVSFLMKIIPSTFVGAFSEGNVLQILFLSVLSGFALISLGDYGTPIVRAVDVISKMLFKIVAIIMWAAPIGAFGAMAFTVGKFGAGSLFALSKLLAEFYATCLVFVFLVLGPIAHWCGAPIFKLIRYIREELLICFATTSSETVLPRMITKMESLGCERGIVGLVIPTGYSFNLDGTCLYLAAAAIFLAQATNTPLDITQQIGLLFVLLLTSKGAAGIAGAAFVVLAATLSAAGTIPVASVALILGIHRLMSEGLTPTNLVGNAVATLVISKWENNLDHTQLTAELNRL
jgi:aerobic C4-dicarboxylate transport protein